MWVLGSWQPLWGGCGVGGFPSLRHVSRVLCAHSPSPAWGRASSSAAHFCPSRCPRGALVGAACSARASGRTACPLLYNSLQSFDFMGQASINLGHTQSVNNWCGVVVRTCKLKENSRASLDVWTWAAPHCPAGGGAGPQPQVSASVPTGSQPRASRAVLGSEGPLRLFLLCSIPALWNVIPSGRFSP